MSSSKLTTFQLTEIAKAVLWHGESCVDICDKYGVSSRTVQRFIARDSYKGFWREWENQRQEQELQEAISNGVKIWIYDIETSPSLGYFWSAWKQNISTDQELESWQMLTWAGKWFGSNEVLFDSCIAHGDHLNDAPIVKSLLEKFDEADIIVAHNGNKFDQRKTNARAIVHGFRPPSPYRQIDTLKICKENFSFTRNNLDYVAKMLCGYGKIPTGGFELWAKCMQGDEDAWKTMLEYNINDVEILENVWVALAPWDKKCPSIATQVDSEIVRCTSPACSSTDIKKTGKTVKTNVSEFTGYVCGACGHHMRGRKNIRSKGQMNTTLMNAM